MSAAFHLGEHSLLLERRHSLEHHHDYSHDLPMGDPHGGAVGGEDPGADGDGFATPAENQAVFISCSSHADAGDNTLIHVERWRPPDSRRRASEVSFARRRRFALCVRCFVASCDSVRTWFAFHLPTHLVELADGHRYVYDKLVSTLSLAAIEFLVATDLPRHVRRDESLRYWLSEHDIEVADRAIQDYYGDLDEFAAGKRVARSGRPGAGREVWQHTSFEDGRHAPVPAAPGHGIGP